MKRKAMSGKSMFLAAALLAVSSSAGAVEATLHQSPATGPAPKQAVAAEKAVPPTSAEVKSPKAGAAAGTAMVPSGSTAATQDSKTSVKPGDKPVAGASASTTEAAKGSQT